MNYKMIRKTQNAQVLLITLLILTVIGIVIVGLVTLANRDVTQVVTSEKYETLYNNAETEARKIIDNYGAYDKALTDLPQTFSSSNCTAIQDPINYKCTITGAAVGSTQYETVVDITDKREVENFEVKKDRSFTMKINGYTGGLNIRWDKPAAVEFTIIAQDNARNLKVIKDVYDMAGVYEGLAGDNPYTPSANHTINYQQLDPANRPQTTTINLTPTGVNGLAASDYVYYVTITPRLKQDNSSVKFSIVPSNLPAFPYQIREFVSSSLDKNDTSSPLAKVITQIPLAPQMDSVFDYALISNSAINSF